MKNHTPQIARVWILWCALLADALRTLLLVADPDQIILAGGLSKVPGVAKDVATALQAAQFKGFAIPDIVVAQGGDTSGARGAAFAAYQQAQT
jgi:N-acetylglucosamine kinase